VLNIKLLGKLDIFCKGVHLTGLESHKVEELLCYLLLHRDQTLSRETVADLLWGEINPGQSKNYLRKSLWQLQTRLERCANSDQERFLIADSYWVQINPDIELWLDVAVIEDTFNGVKGKAGRELFTDQAQKIKQAVEFYRGDLLDGWYQEW
jgi:DNA-binding SARP family transcriptional activator